MGEEGEEEGGQPWAAARLPAGGWERSAAGGGREESPSLIPC